MSGSMHATPRVPATPLRKSRVRPVSLSDDDATEILSSNIAAVMVNETELLSPYSKKNMKDTVDFSETYPFRHLLANFSKRISKLLLQSTFNVQFIACMRNMKPILDDEALEDASYRIRLMMRHAKRVKES